MRQLLVYLFIGLAAAAFIFIACQRLAHHTAAYILTLQEQRLEQLDYLEQPEAYQPTREQLQRIESYSDIITETEADYLEMMGHHSPDIRAEFPHVTTPELWDVIYDRELAYFHKYGELSQQVLNQIKGSKERSAEIQRVFGDLKEQNPCP